MKKFKLQAVEISTAWVEVEAEDIYDAQEQVEAMWSKGEIEFRNVSFNSEEEK